MIKNVEVDPLILKVPMKKIEKEKKYVKSNSIKFYRKTNYRIFVSFLKQY